MAALDEVVRFLDQELRTGEIPDYEAALNGLQLSNSGNVSRVAAAVDFSTATVAGALKARADLLVVHHGMFWGGAERIIGPVFERLRMAMDGGLAVYSSHLPLDVHPSLGNNALFARELNLEPSGTFGRYKTIEIGVSGSAAAVATADLFARVREYSSRYSTAAVCTSNDKSRRTHHWAIVTGAGASSDTLREAVERGIDTLIVGEGPHHTAVQAADAGITVLYLGHYASETLGVIALATELGRRFGIRSSFIEAPSGL